MNQKKIIQYCLAGILGLISISCEYYLGINQQPKFTNENVDEGMNIFGLLRPDSHGDFNKSFVFVQKMWPVLELGGYSIIQDVSVWVEHIADNQIVEIIEFPLVPADTLFADTLYRPLESFTPQPGEKYRLVCQLEGFPDATGELIFPGSPVIRENSLSVEGRNVSFILIADSLIAMIDIYLTGDDYSNIIDRFVPSEESDTEIELVLPVDPQGMKLQLFAYDPNLAVYYGNSNTSLNFNKYRTTISTLESGYGVFGALNYSTIELDSSD